MEAKHEVYNGDIPEHEEMEMDTREQLEEMKRMLKQMEEETTALREMQAKVSQEMQIPDPATSAAADLGGKQGVDSRSVFVGNVDYSCTPEEVQQHFQSCGTVNRVTIRADKFGQPKGYAYVEFSEVEAVQNALLLNLSELHNRQLKVTAKRTNVPGMKNYGYRGQWFNPYPVYRPPPRPRYSQPYFYHPYPPSSYGYGITPTFRPSIYGYGITPTFRPSIGYQQPSKQF